MNEIQIFNSPEFGDMRTIIINGEPWFIGKYVASVLGYTRPDNTVTERIEEDERIYIDRKTHPEFKDKIDYKELGQRGGWIINESGLYSLIFGSKLESAKKFKKWVTSEVLPSIRRNGTYQLPQSTDGKIALLAQGHTELKAEVDSIREDLEALKMDLPILPIEADKITEAVRKKGVAVLGGKQSNAYNNRCLRQKLYNNLYANLKYNFSVRSYKSIKRIQCDKAIEVIQRYEPPFFLAQQIEQCNAQQNFDLEGGVR